MYFVGWADAVELHVPIRGKYCKKHGRIVGARRNFWRKISAQFSRRNSRRTLADGLPPSAGKFDHYCYALGNSVGELNHGAFWRFLFVQTTAIWTGKFLLDHAYLAIGRRVVWAAVNAPLLAVNILSWAFGVPLSILLLVHGFNACTSTTTYEFLKLEKLAYLKGFYECSCPFSEGWIENVRHFCCPRGPKLWRRPDPESEWPETIYRNRYYTCFG